jgi:hypothetical protein
LGHLRKKVPRYLPVVRPAKADLDAPRTTPCHDVDANADSLINDIIVCNLNVRRVGAHPLFPLLLNFID